MTGKAFYMGPASHGREDSIQAVYRLEPPLTVTEKIYTDDDSIHEKTHEVNYVWVSAVPHVYLEGPETYIFECDAAGTVLSWLEMGGSFKGGMDHARALAGLGDGYEIVAEEEELCQFC